LFDNIEKLSKILIEIMTPVSSMNITGTDMVFIVERGSFIQIMKSKGPKIDPWGTPYFM
jgi:hypothetical protein